jgi:hypothetical protein
MTSAMAQAHLNIAFIKYWGNRDNALRLPASGTGSLEWKRAMNVPAAIVLVVSMYDRDYCSRVRPGLRIKYWEAFKMTKDSLLSERRNQHGLQW